MAFSWPWWLEHIWCDKRARAWGNFSMDPPSYTAATKNALRCWQESYQMLLLYFHPTWGTSLQPRMYRAHSKQIWTTGAFDTDLANGSSILSYDYHTLYARVGSMPEVGVGPGKTQPLFSDHSWKSSQAYNDRVLNFEGKKILNWWLVYQRCWSRGPVTIKDETYSKL